MGVQCLNPAPNGVFGFGADGSSLASVLRISPVISTPSPSPQTQMSYSLNSLKEGYIGDYIGDYYRGY